MPDEQRERPLGKKEEAARAAEAAATGKYATPAPPKASVRDGAVTVPIWSTACPDWEDRIVNGESLIPFDPLFPDEASAALDIFKGLRIVDAPGRPTMGEACRPWVFDFVATIFGSYDSESGRRLIRYFFLLIAKKNIKSTLAAGVMVTALIRNWRESGEFYILAPTKEVADNSFAPARDMVQADETLSSILKPSAGRVIEHRNTGAFLKVVAADSETVAGKKTIGLFVDELWLFGKRANAANIFREAMGGLASRPEGFVIDASTQGDGPPPVCSRSGSTNSAPSATASASISAASGCSTNFPKRMIEAGEYKDPKNFYIPNPNLNASVDEQYLLEQLAEAQQDGQSHSSDSTPSTSTSSQAWRCAPTAGPAFVVWDRGIEVGLTLDEILLDRCEVVTIGIDGGGLDDLLGVALIGREKGTKRWLGWAHALISDVGIERRKANIEDYNRFEQQGDLTKFEYVLPPITIELQKQLDGSYRDNGGEAPLAPVGTVAPSRA
jgi:phage terminase large subunit-like protein